VIHFAINLIFVIKFGIFFAIYKNNKIKNIHFICSI
jgi:hypothetical protein